jgi:hypothetical protein
MTYLKIVIFHFLALSSCANSGQLDNRNTEISTNQIYQFIASNLVIDSLINQEIYILETPLKNLTGSPPMTGTHDSDFLFQLSNRGKIDSLDAEFILLQKKQTKLVKWNEALLHHKVLKKELWDSIFTNPEIKQDKWEYFHKKFPSQGYCLISLPYFTKNGQTVFVGIEFYGGMLSASGHVWVFKLENEKWIRKENWQMWIS